LTKSAAGRTRCGRVGWTTYPVVVPSPVGPARPAKSDGTQVGPSQSPARPRTPTILDQVNGARARIEAEGHYQNVHVIGADLSRLTAAHVEVVAARLERVDLAGAQLPGVVVRDVVIDRGDWANIVAYQAHLTRSTLRGVRLTGAQIVDGGLSDVVFEDAKLDLAVFRSSRMRRVEFRGCNLARADFANASIGGATFIDCDLAGAQFSQAKAEGARFSHCQLDGIGGVTSLSGASMSNDDLVLLTRVFAKALGIEIVEAIGDSQDSLSG
jgi:uncharacterized protein YjbI with pentapeptide repeats